MTADQLAVASKYATMRATQVSLLSADHGPRHWRDVARIARVICGMAEGIRTQVPFLFAALHDTQRFSEVSDPDHGLRAAELAGEMAEVGLIELSEDDTAALIHALTYHDHGSTSIDLRNGICWDADRLTIGRVGHTPDLAYFSTFEVRHAFEEMLAVSADIQGSDDKSWAAIAREYGP